MAADQSNQKFKLENLFNVKDKVALITGGGSGIGLMAAQTLAVNGAKVYITGRTESKLNRVAALYDNDNASGKIIPLAADVTNKDEIRKLADEISTREGHLSILMNNAGISSNTQETEPEDPTQLRENLFDDPAVTFDEWDSVFRTNVSQIFFMTTAFLPLLQRGSERERGWSSTVINTTSISGIVKVSQHHFAYNATKAAAIHLTKMLAQEVSSSKLRVRVNNIAPGVFPSEMTAGESDEAQKSYIPAEKYREKVPAARPGKDEDMAGAVLFAACNQYLNGQTVVVDGGYVLAAGTV
ncbi:Short chain dehydrogenase/reductase family [Penicillium paradoxum]|uniref:Short chain dehydrogenase/reductase family n=1 Tax=Penicillium paradoxum TaxID=176176 RepID=UPI002547F970|nr:Short chain dehydrogenase/reductase family [Penicillium paradoxum]KAJ5782384.1 Short chain dehydrogenase/reductase family [Penicillium paradoxum]